LSISSRNPGSKYVLGRSLSLKLSLRRINMLMGESKERLDRRTTRSGKVEGKAVAMQTIKTCRGLEVWLHSFLTSARKGSEFG